VHTGTEIYPRIARYTCTSYVSSIPNRRFIHLMGHPSIQVNTGIALTSAATFLHASHSAWPPTMFPSTGALRCYLQSGQNALDSWMEAI